MGRYQIPPLADEVEFEQLINALCDKKYQTDSFQLYGRRGSTQHGIDGLSFLHDKSIVVYQAKKKDIVNREASKLKKELLKELESEVEKFHQEFIETKGFIIKDFIFASTYKRDTNLQDKALKLSYDYGFHIMCWSWDDISDMIEEHEDIFKKFYPQFFYIKDIDPLSFVEKFYKNSALLLSSKNLFISNEFVEVEEIKECLSFLEANNEEQNILVITGKAGIGKTALLSEVQNRLHKEKKAYLSIKSDQLELDQKESLSKQFEVDDLYSAIIKLSQTQKVTILIDQLDALSLTLSSDRKGINYILEFIESLRDKENINILVSVREYDLKNDPLLKQIDSANKIELKSFDREKVLELLNKRGIDKDRFTEKLLTLLEIPLNLALFFDIYDGAISYRDIKSLQNLYEEFWKIKILKNRGDLNQNRLVNFVYQLADKMNQTQRVEISKLLFEDEYYDELDLLISKGVLSLSDNKIKFFHQTFYDFVFARNFIKDDRSLFEYIVSTHQGLDIREQVKQIVEFLRGTDFEEYLKQIELFLLSDKIHFHLKLLIFSYLGALEKPHEKEFELLEMSFKADENNLLYFVESWISIGWMDYFVDSGYFKREYLELEKIGFKLLYKPEVFVNHDSERMIEIVENFPEVEQKTDVVFYLLDRINLWNKRALELFEKYEDIAKYNERGFSYIHFLEKIQTYDIDLAIKKLFSYMYDEIGDQNIENERELLDFGIIEFIKKLIKIAPKQIIDRSLKYIEDIVKRSVFEHTKKDYLISDSTFFHMDQFDFSLYDIWKLYKTVLDQLKIYAKDDREFFLEILKPYIYSQYETMLGFFILGCEEVYEDYLDELYVLFTNQRLLEEKSFDDEIGYTLMKLIEKSFFKFDTKKQLKIIDTIKNVNPIWETSRIGDHNDKKYQGNYRGWKQYELLLQIPHEQLKEFSVYKYFQELQRKFYWHKESKPHKSRVESVGAPLREEAYKSMSLEEWKQSMKVYSKNSERKKSEWISRGEISQHANVFSRNVESNPDRFYDFLFELKAENIDEHYLSLGLNALIESKYDKEKIAEFILYCVPNSNNSLKITILRAIDSLVGREFFDERFIDIFEAFKDIEYKGIVRDKKTYRTIHDEMTTALNSLQGTLAELLPKVLENTHNKNRVIRLIHYLIDNKQDYVIFGLMRTLGYIDRYDRKLYKEFIFSILDNDVEGKKSLYLFNSIHIFLNRGAISFDKFSKYVYRCFDFCVKHLDKESDEKDYQSNLGQILFYHFLNDNDKFIRLLDDGIKSSNHILKGVISQAFYEVKNAKEDRIELSKEYIVKYKNDESAAWHIHFAIKNFKGLKLIENDIEFIKNLAKSKFTLKESYDFWDYLKNEFYNNKRLSGQILEIIDIFIEAHSSLKEDSYDYRSKERIEFLMELYSRFDDEHDKERCLEIIDKFLMNDQYRNSIQSYLEDN